MRRFLVLAAGLWLAGSLAAPVLANTWCSGQASDTVFCEDFDRYCSSPPPYPQECNANWDATLFRSTWVPSGTCQLELIDLITDWSVSPPASAMLSSSCNEGLGYARRPISSQIQNHFGVGCTSVAGTDLHPLVLEFVMNGYDLEKAIYSDSYLELSGGDSADLTDWAYSTEWCNNCKGNLIRYPIICQQEAPGSNCPPISGAPHRASIAAGFLAHLDNNPCHPGESDNRPRNPHLAFFDGYKWYSLRSGLFPGSGDFRIRDHENHIKITIRSASFKVELTCPGTSEHSECELPRDYIGPFSSMTLGYKMACRLGADAWACETEPGCVLASGYAAAYDNVILRGGTCYALPGACCLADTSCLQAYPGDCATLNGNFAGPGTLCAEVACCPPLPPDHDMDGDVDLEDFGWFQTCLSSGPFVEPPTIPCRCADLDRDNDVDIGDFTGFSACLSGAGIPADPSCDD